MGDLGGYGIADQPPTGPHFARGPFGPLGEIGDPWEVGLQFHIRPRHPCRNYPYPTPTFAPRLLSSSSAQLQSDHTFLRGKIMTQQARQIKDSKSKKIKIINDDGQGTFPLGVKVGV